MNFIQVVETKRLQPTGELCVLATMTSGQMIPIVVDIHDGEANSFIGDLCREIRSVWGR